MGLTHSGGTKQKHRVERLALGIGGYCHANAHRQLVAHAPAIVLKRVVGIELRVDVGHPVLHKRINSGLVGFLYRNRRAIVCRLFTARKVVTIKHVYITLKNPLQCLLEQIAELRLNLFDKIQRGHLKVQFVVLEVECHNRLEPSVVLLGRQIVFYHFKTTVP